MFRPAYFGMPLNPVASQSSAQVINSYFIHHTHKSHHWICPFSHTGQHPAQTLVETPAAFRSSSSIHTQGQCWRWNTVPPLHKAVSSPKPSALRMNTGPHTCLTVSLDRLSHCLNLEINLQAISFHHLESLLGMLRSWGALPTLLLPLHIRIMDT